MKIDFHLNTKLLMIYISIMILNFGFGMITPIFPLYVRQYGISSFVLGIIMSAFSVGRITFQGIGGALSDKYNPQHIAALGIGIYVPSLFIMAVLPNQYLFIISRFIEGAAEGIAIPSLYHLITIMADKKRLSTSFGLFTTFATIGMAAGPAFGGILSKYFNYKWMFIFTGIVALGCSVFIAVTSYINIDSYNSSVDDKNNSTSKKIKDSKFSIRDMFINKKFFNIFFPILTISFITQFTFSSLQLIIPLYTTSRFNVDQSYVGILFSINFIIYSLSQPILGILSDTLFKDYDIIIGSILFSLTYFLYPLVSNSFLFIFLFGLGAFSSALLTISMRKVIAQLKEVFSNTTGKAFGVLGVVGDLGALLGPIISSFFSFNYKYFFILIASITVIIMIFLSFAKMKYSEEMKVL